MQATSCHRASALVVLSVFLVACSDSPTETPEPPTDAAIGALLSLGASAGPNGRHDCPAGGTITSESTVSSSVEGDIVTVLWDISMTHDGCAIQFNDIKLISDGQTHITGRDRRRLTGNGAGAVLESTSHQTGRMRIRSDGYDRTCDMDLTTTLDVTTGRRSIQGTVCGGEVSFTI